MKKYRDDIIQKTVELIGFKSVYDKASVSKNMPYGSEVDKALKFMLDLAKRDGFSVVNVGGHAGHIEYNPSGASEILGILTHLDVVPKGDNWDSDIEAFSGTIGGAIKGGNIYGRGAIDNKGPTIAAYYALKALKDEGYVPNKAIRLIMGCNEEGGYKESGASFTCIENYLKAEKMPDIAFTPDAEFPVINAEKGILQYVLTADLSRQNVYHDLLELVAIRGGDAANMVCDKVEVKLCRDEPKQRSVAKFFKGKSAHASRPQDGANAIWGALEYLVKKFPNTEYFKKLSLLTDFNGQKAGTYLKDEPTGELTHNLGTIDFDGKTLSVKLDIRYPATKKLAEVTSLYQKALGGLFTLTIGSQKDPIVVDESNPLVQNLLKAYNEVMGESAKPKSTGGGTYARAFPSGRCVAFGVRFAHMEDMAHKPNEYIGIDDLLKASEIIKKAIKNLTKV
ncbi:MAG: Sapep family Mn(2+)-dependent dipeptidase [Firmicutes bacterium]|nr:Sapep family Mn(2+)-dependent dipeptidase [Bacillota bacterium]